MKCFTVVVLVLALLAIANDALTLPIILNGVATITIGAKFVKIMTWPGTLTKVSMNAEGATIVEIGTLPVNDPLSFEIAVPDVLTIEVGANGEPWAQVGLLPNADVTISARADGALKIVAGRPT